MTSQGPDGGPKRMAESQQRYRVVEKLESGGMAEVFRAESEGLQGFRKQVAIKRVLPHLSEKKKFISMFLDEARLSAHLSHSNCVQVFDIGVGDNAYFIVMEFVDGANLKTIAESLKKQGQAFPVAAAVFVALEICKGLSYAHELRDPQGNDLHIVHRDMSPPNVLITKYGEVKIVDFGLAKATSQLERSEPGIIKGKFSYLSPEAALGQEVDARADVFAVGIILWELLAGERLFLGDTDFQTVKKVQASVVPPISQLNPNAPAELERMLEKSLAREPNQRYRTARDLGRDLSRFLFQYGHPVSTFDIAQLVQISMRDRDKTKAPQGSIIDKLIEEALFEFTSLTDNAKEASQNSGADGIPNSGSALSSNSGASIFGDFVDPKGWLDEMAASDKSQAGVIHAAPSTLNAGNLSALEEDPSSSGLLHNPAIRPGIGVPMPTPLPVGRPLAAQPPPMQAPPRTMQGAPPGTHAAHPASIRPGAIASPQGAAGGSSKVLIGVLLALGLACLGVGGFLIAWFGGFFRR